MKLFWFSLALLIIFATISTGQEGKDEQVKLNINEATIDELVELPGIGPVKAKAIVDYRDAHGQFEKLTDLLRVRGIGEKGLAKIADLITAGDAKKNETPSMGIRPAGKIAIVWAKLKAGRQ